MAKLTLTDNQKTAVGSLLRRAEQDQGTVIHLTKLLADATAKRDACYADAVIGLEEIGLVPPAVLAELHLAGNDVHLNEKAPERTP